MRTIKRLVQAFTAGQTLKEVSQNPAANIHLDYHLEQLFEALATEKETLRNLVLDKTQSGDEKNIKILKNLYIIDSNGKFIHPLFSSFLREKFSSKPDFEETLAEKIHLKTQLTANEYRALTFLFAHDGEICPREKIATAIWGENASLDISNHALDQLIHRLRKKLKSAEPVVTLETIRGRGHRLTY